MAVVLWLGTSEPATSEQRGFASLQCWPLSILKVEILGILSRGTQHAHVVPGSWLLLVACCQGYGGSHTLCVLSSAPRTPDSQHTGDSSGVMTLMTHVKWISPGQAIAAFSCPSQAKDLGQGLCFWLSIGLSWGPGLRSPRMLHEVCQHCETGYKINAFVLMKTGMCKRESEERRGRREQCERERWAGEEGDVCV